MRLARCIMQPSGFRSIIKCKHRRLHTISLPFTVLLPPPPLKVFTTKTFGRGLYASKPIFEGEVVLRERPFVSIPKVGFEKDYCQLCFKHLIPGSPRYPYQPRTHIASRLDPFCSPSCRDDAWNRYDQLLTQSSHYSSLNAYFRKRGLQYPIMAAKLYAAGIIEHMRGEQQNGVLEIVKNLFSMGVNVKVGKELNELKKDLEMVKKVVKGTADLSLEDYIPLLKCLSLNSFRVSIGESYPCTSLYPYASLFNHACPPTHNADVHWGDDNTIEIVARRNIAQKEQLFVTYLGGGSLEERREILKEYGIWCQCERCKKEELGCQ